jgi:hypothetical protein
LSMFALCSTLSLTRSRTPHHHAGTMKDEAKKLIESSGLPIIAADDLDDAAQRAVLVSKIVEMARTGDLAVTIREKPKGAHQKKEILIQML